MISSSSWRASRRPSVPSSTTYSAISAAIRRTISSRCETAVTSRTVTRSSISSAESVPAHLVQPELVPLQRREGLVGAGEDGGRVLQDPALPVHVERDQPHRLADRDHGEVDLLGDAVGGAVPGAGLVGGDGRVGDELDSGAQDLGEVLVEDDAAVELAQLAQASRRELDVQHEAAGTHRLDGPVPAEHDESAGVPPQNPLQPVPQLGAGGDGAQRGTHQPVGTGPAGLAGGRCPVIGCHCTPPVAGLPLPPRPGRGLSGRGTAAPEATAPPARPTRSRCVRTVRRLLPDRRDLAKVYRRSSASWGLAGL